MRDSMGMYRGKDIAGTWRYGYLFRSRKDKVTSEQIGFYIQEMYDEFTWRTHEVDPETVCQFTGLQDLEGEDIYEGDTLLTCCTKRNPSGYTGSVEYAMHVHAGDLDPTILIVGFVFRFDDGSVGTLFVGDVCEITGNIHDKEEQK